MLTNRRSLMPPPQRASTFSTHHPASRTITPFIPTTTATITDIEPHTRTPSILTSTTPTLPTHHITTVLGTVHGTTTFTRKDTKNFLKSLGPGSSANEAKSLTLMLYQARDQAVERMVRDCVGRGGNAVVGVGFGECEVLGFVQVSCYGTAVLVERERERELERGMEMEMECPGYK